MVDQTEADAIADLQEQQTAALADVAAVNELCDVQQREPGLKGMMRKPNCRFRDNPVASRL